MSVSSWFSKMLGTELALHNLEDVLVLQLRDLTSAEDQLVKALPRMADAAADSELKDTFISHMLETGLQRSRLDEIFRLLGRKTEIETSDAMRQLISEAAEVVYLAGDPEVKDAALIAAAQRIEHYEIAGYGCARTFAQQLGYHEVAHLLQQSLDEERDVDKEFSFIAEKHINMAVLH